MEYCLDAEVTRLRPEDLDYNTTMATWTGREAMITWPAFAPENTTAAGSLYLVVDHVDTTAGILTFFSW